MFGYPLLHKLRRNERGAAVIELALVVPILSAMLIGIVDLSGAYSDKLRLEQVAQRITEKVQQNGFDPGMETALETEAVATAGNGSSANLTWWIECNGIKMTAESAYADGCDNQPVARYVQLEVQRPYMPYIAARFSGSNADGSMTLRGIAGIRIQSTRPKIFRSDEKGAATIEMAFALPVLLLFVYGIFQFGVILQANAGMQHALGEGARLATLFPKPADDVIVTKMHDKVFGMNVGSFSTPTVTIPTGCPTCRELTVRYTVTPNFLFFNAPPITLTRTKRVYTTA